MGKRINGRGGKRKIARLFPWQYICISEEKNSSWYVPGGCITWKFQSVLVQSLFFLRDCLEILHELPFLHWFLQHAQSVRAKIFMHWIKTASCAHTDSQRERERVAEREITCPLDPIPFLRCWTISTGSNGFVTYWFNK